MKMKSFSLVLPKWNRWLLPFFRTWELANHCCVMKNDKGLDIEVDMRENAVLVNDMKRWSLNRKIIKRTGYDYKHFFI